MSHASAEKPPPLKSRYVMRGLKHVAVLPTVNIGYNGDVPRTGLAFKANGVQPKKCDAIDVAARYFVYKLFEATDHRPVAWQVLRGLGEAPATVARAVQRGWVIVRSDDGGRIRGQSGCLTDEGRLLALKGLRR